MALSVDLRKRIIEAYENKEGSIRTLAKRFKTASSTIWELLKRYKIEKQLKPTSPPGRTPKIGKKEIEIIRKLVQKRDDATLAELCKQFKGVSKIEISPSSMHRICLRENIRYKKNAFSRRTISSRY